MALVAGLLLAAVGEPPTRALWWNMSAATAAEELSYSEQVTAFAAQGIFNRNGSQLAFFDVGEMNYDWPHAEAFWRDTLRSAGRVDFAPVAPTLCALVAATQGAAGGAVLYDGSGAFGDGYSAAIALTLAGQRSLLPVAAESLARHACLAGIPVAADLRDTLAGKTRGEAWEWAVATLLPRSSKDIVMNLNHYRTAGDPAGFRRDKQSNATASSLDYAVMRNAFVIDLESHASTGTSTAPWGSDDVLIERVFAQMNPLFDAYGWADDEFSWTNETSHFGGTIMCSFASPDLSFWARLPLAGGAASARRLPGNDRGAPLNASKYYVTFETNEGDTPRVLASAMCSSWAAPERGSLPVAWAIDPLLADRFPALFDYFAATATANDSFIAGTAGAGYAFLNQMSAPQLQTYGERVGALTKKYGPNVLDTYGYCNVSCHEAYARAAAAGGAAPAAFVTQPNWPRTAYDPYRCPSNNMVLSDGTPLVCTAGGAFGHELFYYSATLNPLCPSCDLAARIERAARAQPPPFFTLVYGGLQAFGGAGTKSKKSFFTLLTDTAARLSEDFVVVGAADMARLAREARA